MISVPFERVSRQFRDRETADSSARTREQTPAGGEETEAVRARLLDAIAYGTIGGLIATLSMTTFRMPTSKSLPPTAEFWAKFVGSGEPGDYPATALLLHLLYGIGGGIVFALLRPGKGDPEAAAEAKAALLGTVYGAALSVFGSRVVLEGVLGVTPDRDERLVFHISHIIYGLTLGTWVGSRFGVEQLRSRDW